MPVFIILLYLIRRLFLTVVSAHLHRAECSHRDAVCTGAAGTGKGACRATGDMAGHQPFTAQIALSSINMLTALAQHRPSELS